MIEVAKGLCLCLVLIGNVALAANTDVSAGATTSTNNNSDQNFEWTLEKMLMATAMPMTGEERQFLQTHKNLDGIRDWTYADFKSYVSDNLGKKHVAEEAGHWQGILKMLKEEAAEQSAGAHKTVPDSGADVQPLDSVALDKMLKQPDGAGGCKDVFEAMQGWRKQIAILAPYVESMRKKHLG